MRFQTKSFFIVPLFLMLTTTACSTASLSKAGRHVEVVGRSEVQNCEEVEKFVGYGAENFLEFVGITTVANRAISDAMNRAGKMGATHVVLGTVYKTLGENKRVRINAISYKCPENGIESPSSVGAGMSL